MWMLSYSWNNSSVTGLELAHMSLWMQHTSTFQQATVLSELCKLTLLFSQSLPCLAVISFILMWWYIHHILEAFGYDFSSLPVWIALSSLPSMLHFCVTYLSCTLCTKTLKFIIPHWQYKNENHHLNRNNAYFQPLWIWWLPCTLPAARAPNSPLKCKTALYGRF